MSKNEAAMWGGSNQNALYTPTKLAMSKSECKHEAASCHCFPFVEAEQKYINS